MQKIYLIPTFISDEASVETIPSYIAKSVEHIRFFIVENDRSARQFLRKINPQFPLQECQYFTLNERTTRKDIEAIFNEVGEKDMGVLSEAGVPCVADPGAEVVLLAHQQNREIIPLVGPSSIILALMASGLNGQQFTFHGYLPKDKTERLKKIKMLEQISFREKQTQIFMETPYHNESLFNEIILTCAPETFLCLAVDLSSPNQYIKTLSIHDWRKMVIPIINKRPTLFLIQRM